MTFSLRRQRAELVSRTATLTEREWLSPNFVRVRLSGDDLRGFHSAGADDHMRLFFPETIDAENPRGLSRDYTPRSWDGEAGTLDVEFVVHGTDGIAGPWAATAPLGTLIGVGGPRGSLVLDGRPAWWFLAGDESALPAMRRFIEQMDADATGLVLIEVVDAAHEQPLDVPAGVELRWLHRETAPAASALAGALDALTAEQRPGADPGLIFIAAEQSIVKPGRALALERWGADAEQTVVKGYWKSGEAQVHEAHGPTGGQRPRG